MTQIVSCETASSQTTWQITRSQPAQCGEPIESDEKISFAQFAFEV